MARHHAPAPGQPYTNTTGRVRYQWVAHLNSACALCLDFHGLIRDEAWPIPTHPHCRCSNRVIWPDETAEAAPTVREIFDTLTPAERAHAYGAANAKLVAAGLATTDDVVGVTRVLDFREVVANKKLTFKQLTKAGVPGHTAREALAHPPGGDHADAVRLRTDAAAKAKADAEKAARAAVLTRQRLDAAEAKAGASRAVADAEKAKTTAPAPLTLPVLEKALGVRFKAAAHAAVARVGAALGAVGRFLTGKG